MASDSDLAVRNEVEDKDDEEDAEEGVDASHASGTSHGKLHVASTARLFDLSLAATSAADARSGAATESVRVCLVRRAVTAPCARHMKEAAAHVHARVAASSAAFLAPNSVFLVGLWRCFSREEDGREKGLLPNIESSVKQPFHMSLQPSTTECR